MGRQRALFARMDRAVHQSGVPGPRTLVARGYRTRGALQQLRRAATQCAASTESTAQAKAASPDRLPAWTRAVAARPRRPASLFGHELLTCLQTCLHFEFGAIASGSAAVLAALTKIKERPVGARPLGAWGYGRNMPDATYGSSRGAGSGASPIRAGYREAGLPHITSNTGTFSVLGWFGSMVQGFHLTGTEVLGLKPMKTRHLQNYLPFQRLTIPARRPMMPAKDMCSFVNGPAQLARSSTP